MDGEAWSTTCKEHNVPVGHPHVDANNVERMLNEGYASSWRRRCAATPALDKGLKLAGRGL